MLDFEDVTPRKRDMEESGEEQNENAADEMEMNHSAEEDHPEEAAAEEVSETEPAPQPSVREYHYEEQVKKAPKKKKSWVKFVVGCLIIGIAGGASIGAGYSFVDNLMTGRTAVSGKPSGIQKASSGEIYSATDIIKAVKPSVVSVSTKISGMTNYWGAFSIPYESEGAGSGVIFYSDDERVAIATNNHVVESANTIYVTFEGDISVPAKVIGTRSESELAVITVSCKELNNAGIEQVTTAVFGDSDALEVGSEVIAIGNAMGMGLSATDGIISMKEQTINVDGNQLGVLQTSAAINSGNSGGALVNASGEVIGINTAKYNSAMVEGMGYAIPSNYITPIVEELLTTGTQPKPYIGITGTNITEETAPMYKLPVGALVLEIVEGSPAEKAGLQVGDVITQFNGQTVMDMDSLVKQVNEAKIGSTADMYVIRDGNTGVELKIRIEDKNS
ncbi:MAG: trypsin-like peptidase domain-containing protein [Anaerotignum sp.]|nr:trypsin-like peptidase domain-containing protein [Anaerotignum sp.]